MIGMYSWSGVPLRVLESYDHKKGSEWKIWDARLAVSGHEGLVSVFIRKPPRQDNREVELAHFK